MRRLLLCAAPIIVGALAFCLATAFLEAEAHATVNFGLLQGQITPNASGRLALSVNLKLPGRGDAWSAAINAGDSPSEQPLTHTQAVMQFRSGFGRRARRIQRRKQSRQ